MRLAALLEGLPLASPLPEEWKGLEVSGLEYDSRRITAGGLFFAFAGAQTDGRTFARQAMERGAAAVISEEAPLEGFEGRWIQVPHGREALAAVSKRFYGAPDERLALTGVTGTNGKTTTVFALDAALRHLGRVTGMVGTIEYRIADKRLEAVNTTPESLELVRMMAQTLAAGGTHFQFEVSSHALELRRVHGLAFHTVLFTNLTQDHLDFHGTMENYFAAKARLFTGAGGPPPKWAVINADDEWGRRLGLAQETKRLTYGLHAAADLKAEQVAAGFEGVRFTVRHPRGRTEVRSPLCGLINVYNLLGCFSALWTYDFAPEEIAAGLGSLASVPGRFERIDEGQPFLVVVDYAHTDDALRNTIRVARGLDPKRVITLFGCGGERDRKKRPLMGQAAGELSDFVVVTSDNPRHEDPLKIINDALVGVRRTDVRHVVEPDREKAIRRAIDEAAPGDIVLLAGKGHEPYQQIGDAKKPFDDRQKAREILRAYGYGKSGTARRGANQA
ncbi:MAG: UDP-N-acetylmuramoyl-L-alanyl-D-glutamate--2,6-diaminopimelate ligase [Bryobacteraceae bacterium]|nr:UDP-N-acetylmuramoyl-L-alanyl-D-glutamate--2,6-diaminopimelate ligase [Bryobacteraceae bacterium]